MQSNRKVDLIKEMVIKWSFILIAMTKKTTVSFLIFFRDKN